ncbi:beta-ketoacyl synthase N-terminal-like domain-containing protein [Krasilnikovia sp. MM14-A1259]|uniref:beta-ketoacyl synthase N-terminal-like domain-containing protein n=1 Tax=Krasilnikovia sp. MM14-A1259 TaxID=3373539 RepID=UPI00380B9B48
MVLRGIDICGVGTVTGYGWGTGPFWDGLVSGKPAATLTPGYGLDGNELAWVARVPDGGERADGRSRFARAMRAAARAAITDARERGWRPGRQVGLLHAVVLGEVDLWRNFYRSGPPKQMRDYLAQMPSTPMSTLMQEYGFHGPAMNVSAMCASGNAGLLTAKAWLDAGIVDDVVFVATDLSLTPDNVEQFVRLGVAVADTEPLDGCRPFQEGSRGFVMGEASAAMVLSRQTDRAYARILGGAMTHDGHHVTSIEPGLTEVQRCFREALANAGVSPSDVRYLNAHGPGTAQCDRAEGTVLETLFPAEARVYSVKPLVGHCQGAASAVEVAAAALAYEHSVVPASPIVAPAHPQLLDGATPMDGGITVKSSLGMGGHNSVLVLAPPA